MSVINLLQLVLFGVIIFGFAGVLLHALSRDNLGKIIAAGISVLILIALFSVLSRNTVDALSVGFYLSLTVIVWGLGLRSLTARKRSGAILLNLGYSGRRWLVLSVALAALVGGWVLYDYFTGGQVEVYRLAQGICWLSIATMIFLMSRQPILIMETGFYYIEDMVTWDNIKTFEWDRTQEGFDILVLRFKRRQWWSDSTRFRIPSTQKDTVEQLLAQRATG